MQSDSAERQPRIHREGSHGVQWGLVVALVLVVVVTGAVAWMLGSGNQLDGTSWVLAQMPESGAGVGSYRVTIAFSDEQATGQAPVNSYGGEYTAGGTVFKVGDIASTLMAGPDDAMTMEAAYFEALATVTAYMLDGDTLTLMDPEGVVYLVFERSE